MVVAGDWGDVTLNLSKKYGQTFAVLNMAHAKSPGGGGGYVHGAPAQEENMFRRTDCHFSLSREKMYITDTKYFNVVEGDYLYTQQVEDLINAKDGEVVLDMNTPRFCFRSGETDAAKFHGYQYLAGDDVFPFYEMLAAAEDLRQDADGKKRTEEEMIAAFDAESCRKRVRAQFETLRHKRQRYAVLSAFGCGAFGNPTEEVANIYAELLTAYKADFDLVAFAIFAPGYGPSDNYDQFKQIFADRLTSM